MNRRPNEQHLFKIESFWNFINAFTLTFDLFNASLLNVFFKKNLWIALKM